MCTVTPGQAFSKRSKKAGRSVQPSPIAVHCTATPVGVRQTIESRRLVVTTWGASVSRARTGSSSVQQALPESKFTPTKSGPARSTSDLSSAACMSPAWFSTAIFTPASRACGFTARSTVTVSAIRAAMPPGERRSSWLPRITRNAREPRALAMRMPVARCSAGVPNSGLNVFEVGQMLHEPSSSVTALSAA